MIRYFTIYRLKFILITISVIGYDTKISVFTRKFDILHGNDMETS